MTTKKTTVKKKADPKTVWRIYSGATNPPSFVGTVITPKGETPSLTGQNLDPMDLGVMFEAHRSPPVLRGAGKKFSPSAEEARALTFVHVEHHLRPIAELADELVGMRLSLRDLFALAALMGDAINRSPPDLASRCYLVADAMLKERGKKEQPDLSELDDRCGFQDEIGIRCVRRAGHQGDHDLTGPVF